MHKITRQDYYYDCSDGCCTEYGGIWKLNDVEVYRGPMEDIGWLEVLKALNIKAMLINIADNGEPVSETDNDED